MTSFLVAVPHGIETAWELHNYLKLPEDFYECLDDAIIPGEHVAAVVYADLLRQMYTKYNKYEAQLPEYCYGSAKERLAEYELAPYPDNIKAIHQEAEKIVEEFRAVNTDAFIAGLAYGHENPLDDLLASGEPFKNIPHLKISA